MRPETCRRVTLTALAGFWAFDDRPPSPACDRILQGQSLFGSNRAVDELNGLALGRLLHQTLPEDVFDRGPQARGQFRLVADARLDNRPELQSALGLGAAETQSLCDSALLFEALLRWGEAAVERLVGEFAFALWDGARQELLLGRDLLGARPLCFFHGKHFIAFASMPSGLHALSEVPYDVDRAFLAERLAMLPQIGPNTCFAGIRRVEPGHLTRWTRGESTTRRHWNPRRPADVRSSDDFADGLRHLFDEAVKAQLRGSRNGVATQLSGGLDSSTVTATAARLLTDERVVAFTAVPRPGFDGPTPAGTVADERTLAEATARLYPNIDHVIVENAGESPLKWLDSHFLYQQQPMSGIANAVWGHAIHRAASARGMNVILKGSAGNLSISYSGLEWLPSLLAEGRISTLAANALRLARGGHPVRSLAARTFAPFLPGGLWRAIRAVTGKPTGVDSHSAVNRAWLARARLQQASSSSHFDERPKRDPFESRVAALLHGDPGNAVKSALAQWGLSVRDPTADKRIIEFCLRVPFEEFVRGGISRSLARRAFADRLPPEVANWRLRGYQSADWYENLASARGEIEEEVAQILRCDGVDEILDGAWLGETLRSWPQENWHDPAIERRYRLGLLRGISAGHFIRKVRGTN